MEGSKQFGTGEDFPQMSPSSGKPILQFDPTMPANFTDLLDTFANYTGKAGKLLVINVNENGITVIDPSELTANIDKNYIHTQVAPATLWTVNHSLGKYPSVRIKGADGHGLVGDIVDVSDDQLTIEFSSAQSGVAIIN